MSFSLKNVVPWGRSFNEYVNMFSLSDGDLAKKIVGCGDGPASFNCTLSKRGGSVVSVDPIYQFTADDIARRITETYDSVMEQTRQNLHEFVWQRISSLEKLGRIRKCGCRFVDRYPAADHWLCTALLTMENNAID
jgi:hypothetical protein